MTATDYSAIAECVMAAAAALTLIGWTARKLQRAWKLYRQKQAKRVQSDAFPMVITIGALAAFLVWLSRGGDS